MFPPHWFIGSSDCKAKSGLYRKLNTSQMTGTGAQFLKKNYIILNYFIERKKIGWNGQETKY